MQTIRISSSSSIIRNKVSCVCGHCGNTISLNTYAVYKNNDTNREMFETGQCPYCGKPIIYNILSETTMPYSLSFEDVKHLPQDINSLYNEIRQSFSVGAYTCCVIAARTLMANIAVEQGDSAGKTFIDYVNYLQTNCLPSRTNNEWVDKIRKLGNDSTHKLVIATKQDAELSIKFIVAILKNVYEFPNSI